MATQSELETLFVTFKGDDKQLEATFKKILERSKEVATEIRKTIQAGLGGEMVDEKALDATFTAVISKATQAAQAIRAVSEAQAAHADAVKAATADLGKNVQEAADAATRAAQAAADGVTGVATAATAAADASQGMADATAAAADATQDMEGWADRVAKAMEAMVSGGKNTKVGLDELAKEIASLGDASQEAEIRQELLGKVIDTLSLKVKQSRNLWAGRVSSDQEFTTSTRDLRQALLSLRDAGDLTDKQMKDLTQSVAYAQRGLDSAAGVASRGGLAWTVQIALTNQFGDALRGLGPAGGAAATALKFFGGSLGSLQAPLTAADFGLDKIAKMFIKLPQMIGLATSALTIGLGVALYKAAVGAGETADKIDKAAQSAGFTAEAFQEVAFALEQSSVSMDQTQKGLAAFNQRLGQAAQGTAGIADAYQRLGVDIRDTNGIIRSSEDVFEDVITRLGQYASAADKAALGAEIFGKDFAKVIIPALKDGAQGFNELRKQARDMGLILTGQTVQSLVDFKTEMGLVKRQIETARIEIVSAFLPVLRQALVPVLQNLVVPALQTAATRVGQFTQKFLDQTPAGVEFRAQMVKNLEPLLRFGDIVIGIGQGFASFANLVVGYAAGIGRVLGTLSVQAQQFAARMASIGEGLAWWQQGNWLGGIEIFKRLRDTIADTFDPDELGRSFEEAAGTYLDRAFAQASAGQERLIRALSGDYSAIVENLSRNLAGAAEVGASAFNNLGDAAEYVAGALGDLSITAPEGSIAFAEAAAAAAAKAFSLAVDDEARAAAKALETYWLGVAASIKAAFEKEDPLAAARLWTDRLTEEMRVGAKSAGVVFDLVADGVERWKREVDRLFHEVGWQDADYQDAVAKLEFLESFLQRLTSQSQNIEFTVDVAPAVQLVGRDLTNLTPIATVLERPLANAAFLIHKFTSDASDDFQAFRSDYSDFADNVALHSQVMTDSLDITLDTFMAMIAAGKPLAELDAAIRRSKFTSMGLIMGGPGGSVPAADIVPDLGLIQAALAKQADAWADLQSAMTEEQIVEAGRRYAAAQAEVQRLEALYKGADLTPPDPALGETVRAQLGQDLAAAARQAAAFGNQSEYAATALGLVESAIKRLLAENPAAFIDDLVAVWERWNIEMLESGEIAPDLRDVMQQLEAAQANLAKLTGQAPSQWDELRTAFNNAAAAAILTREELEKLLETIDEFEGVEKAAQAMNELAGNIDLGSGIAEGLTKAIESIQAGDLQGAVGGLTQLGTSIGTLIGGPAVGALVGAIGRGVQAAIGLFQTISDLFTGDSPARRKLAQSLASTVAGAFRTGIIEGMRGGEDWQKNLKQGVQEAVLGAVVDAFIQAAVMQAIFQPFIDTFTKILNKSGVDAAFDYFDSTFEGFWNDAMSVIEGFVARGSRYFEQVENQLPDPLNTGRIDLPTATVGVLAAPQWALELGTAATRIREAGDAMLTAAQMMQATFQGGITVNTQSTRGVDAYRGAA